MSPEPRKPWQDDPGHIHDSPGPPPMPDEKDKQDELGVPGVSLAAEPRAHTAESRGDPAPVPELSEVEVPGDLADEIRRAMERYPEKRSASIPALWSVQRRYGYCTPEGIEQAAAVMGVTPGYLHSVASFYDLFHLEPQGSHQVLVCTNISCWLRGADDLLAAFKEAAPEDVTIRSFECLGACDLAPMVSIDARYYGPLADADAPAALEALRSGSEVLPAKRLEGRAAAGGTGGPADERVASHAVNATEQPGPR
ncbi:MAG: NAD(P)H-dependent oxidoreductase subunit E [Actinomycetota bacterium]|nr:NAD(P)H-dependent oxidoreductase subunit E [Actinomycetota bacterium]